MSEQHMEKTKDKGLFALNVYWEKEIDVSF